MRILYVTQLYEPENVAGAFRASDHARAWCARGHEVTVLTGWPHYPKGEVFEGYEVDALGEEWCGPVRVLRSRVVARPLTSFVRRIQNGLGFLWFGALNAVFRKRDFKGPFDVVFGTSGTVFAGWLGFICARRFKLPFVVEFRDLTFEQMVATGSRREGLGVRLMKAAELSLAKRGDRIVVLTEGFRDILAREGIPLSKISVVPNGADPCPVTRAVSPDVLSFGYFGTLGLSQDIPGTIECAARAACVAGREPRYLIIGEGAARGDIEETIGTNRYPFCELLHGMSKDDLEKHYATCDMTVVSLRKAEEFASTIPSRVFQSLARGIPVLFLGPEGECSRLVSENRVGVTLTGTPDENDQILSEFFGSPDWEAELTAMGERALALMDERYSRRVLADRVVDVLSDAAGVDPDGRGVS